MTDQHHGVRVPLHSQRHPGLFALVDPEDSEMVNQRRWIPTKVGRTYYMVSFSHGVRTYLHRLLLGDVEGRVVDHINGDGLDNRRSNLRHATNSQNITNLVRRNAGKYSKYRGVSRFPRTRCWQARIGANGKGFWLGNFASEEEAARAYDEAARKLHGEFARLNFPNDGEQAA